MSFWASGMISEIVADMVSKGPSMTVTVSPTSKAVRISCTGAGLSFFFSAASSRTLGVSSMTTSSMDSGTGLCWSPTNPVTAGVSFTTR